MRGRRKKTPPELPPISQLEQELAREKYRRRYRMVLRSTTYVSFMVFDGIYLRGHNLADWTPDKLRTLIYADGKFNFTTEQTPSNAVKLYTLVSGEAFTGASIDSSTVVITNTYAGGIYELPETGGPGIFLYTMGGLGLMAGALLLYKIQDRKKGRRDHPC